MWHATCCKDVMFMTTLFNSMQNNIFLSLKEVPVQHSTKASKTSLFFLTLFSVSFFNIGLGWSEMYYYDGCDYEDMGYDGCDAGFVHEPECYEDSDCRGSDICEFNYCVSNPNRADDGHEDDPDFGYNYPDADFGHNDPDADFGYNDPDADFGYNDPDADFGHPISKCTNLRNSQYLSQDFGLYDDPDCDMGIYEEDSAPDQGQAHVDDSSEAEQATQDWSMGAEQDEEFGGCSTSGASLNTTLGTPLLLLGTLFFGLFRRRRD